MADEHRVPSRGVRTELYVRQVQDRVDLTGRLPEGAEAENATATAGRESGIKRLMRRLWPFGRNR